MEKYGTVRQATNDYIMWRMLFACSITKVTHTHPDLLSYGNNSHMNAPEGDVTRTLPLLL